MVMIGKIENLKCIMEKYGDMKVIDIINIEMGKRTTLKKEC